LTSRNVGAPAASLDRERRINMHVSIWELADTVTTASDSLPHEHPRIFVARGTHSLYLKPGVHPITPFTPDDLSWMSCGAGEGLAHASLEPALEAVTPPVIIMKVTAGMRLGALAGGIAGVLPGAVAGVLWALDELAEEPAGAAPSASQQQIDAAPPHNDYSMVIKPANVTLSEPVTPKEWPSQNTIVEGGRVYTLIVDRVDPDPNSRHVWLPGEGDNPGYEGRWGPRVTKDPRGRRAGMRFPDFVEMFLVAIAKT
jgi:hypothetical protein